MTENIIAAVAGSLASAFNHFKKGWLVMSQMFVSSLLLSYYLAPDIADFLRNKQGIMVSYLACHFLLAYFGSAVLDKVTFAISVLRVPQWKQ